MSILRSGYGFAGFDCIMVRITEYTTTIIDHIPSHRLLLYHVVSFNLITVIIIVTLSTPLSTPFIVPLPYHYVSPLPTPQPPNPPGSSLIADSRPPRSP